MPKGKGYPKKKGALDKKKSKPKPKPKKKKAIGGVRT